jgi:pimeloyl-ACP methyl ester carboxylesterase
MLAAAATIATSVRPHLLARPLWREVRSGAALGAAAGAPWPAGAGAPVLLIPGFMAGDASLNPLAHALAARGHRPVRSGIARNVDCSEQTVRRLLDRLETIAARSGHAVAIVGHSRGGVLGRVLARRRPELVRGLLTLGSPHADQLALHPLLWSQVLAIGMLGTLRLPGLLRLGCQGGRCCAEFDDDVAAPVAHDLPFLSLYSRADGVVDWRACLVPCGRHREVRTTHCGMPGDGAVLDQVLDFLRRCA